MYEKIEKNTIPRKKLVIIKNVYNNKNLFDYSVALQNKFFLYCFQLKYEIFFIIFEYLIRKISVIGQIELSK